MNENDFKNLKKALLLIANIVVIVVLKFGWLYNIHLSKDSILIYKILLIIIIPCVLHGIYSVNILSKCKSKFLISVSCGILSFAIYVAIFTISITAYVLLINWISNGGFALFGWRVLQIPLSLIIGKILYSIKTSIYEELLFRFYFFEALVEIMKNRKITAILVSVFLLVFTGPHPLE